MSPQAWETWETLPPGLVPIDQVPLGEVQVERPERAMAPSAAKTSYKITVHGAEKREGRWVVYFEYVTYNGRHYETPTTHKSCYYLKQTHDGDLFTTISTGPTPMNYRDVYLKLGSTMV